MAKPPKDVESIELARKVLAIVEQVPPRVLCTVRADRGSYYMQTGSYYSAEERYPSPPLRAHQDVHDAQCAECSDFRRWRRSYADWASATGTPVLPEMVAPAAFDLESLPHWKDPDSTWLHLVARMVEAAG